LMFCTTFRPPLFPYIYLFPLSSSCSRFPMFLSSLCSCFTLPIHSFCYAIF
jgi:hypothetical protein